MSRVIVLTDKDGNQVTPITRAEDVFLENNKTVADAINEGLSDVITDSELSSTSLHPVENRIVKSALDLKADTTLAFKGVLDSTSIDNTDNASGVYLYEDSIVILAKDGSGLLGIPTYQLKINGSSIKYRIIGGLNGNVTQWTDFSIYNEQLYYDENGEISDLECYTVNSVEGGNGLVLKTKPQVDSNGEMIVGGLICYLRIDERGIAYKVDNAILPIDWTYVNYTKAEIDENSKFELICEKEITAQDITDAGAEGITGIYAGSADDFIFKPYNELFVQVYIPKCDENTTRTPIHIYGTANPAVNFSSHKIIESQSVGLCAVFAGSTNLNYIGANVVLDTDGLLLYATGQANTFNSCYPNTACSIAPCQDGTLFDSNICKYICFESRTLSNTMKLPQGTKIQVYGRKI